MKPVTHNKTGGGRANIREHEYIESIVDVLEKEMAHLSTNPHLKDPSIEMDLLVTDLLGYLSVDSIEE